MKSAHATPLKDKKPKQKQNLTATLEQEAHELEALHLGLRRHLTAWRSAHDATVARLDAVMAHMDAVLERAGRANA